MAKRNGFAEGFLQGLYASGVGNPEVRQKNEALQLEKDKLKQTEMTEQGMTPVPGTLPADHPVRSKIKSFISSLMGGGGGSQLASAYQPDPNQPQYTMQPTGQVTSLPPGIPVPTGQQRLNPKTGQTMLATQFSASRPEPVYTINPKTGQMEKIGDAQKGAHFTNVPTGGDEKIQKEIDARFIKLGEALDPSKQRQGSFGVSKQVFDRAERLESLASALPDGNLDRRQIEELAIGLNSMLSGANTGAQEQVKALVPQSIWGNAQKLTEFLTNNPTGTQQQAFVQRMLGSIAREKQTANSQMNRTRFSRIASYADLEKKNPDMFNEVLQSNGVDPLEYKAWKKGGFKAINAVTAPGEDGGNKPKTVIQNGHTYNLNPLTGKYE